VAAAAAAAAATKKGTRHQQHQRKRSAGGSISSAQVACSRATGINPSLCTCNSLSLQLQLTCQTAGGSLGV
jgi:hypothetical protein